MVNDTIADVLTRIRNAQRAGHKSVRVSASRSSQGVLTVLRDEGFVESFEVVKDRADKFDECNVVLKYFGSGEPVIDKAKRMSTPGRRVYSGVEDLPRVDCGLGISIISTSKGIISDREARKQHIGGEVLATVSS